MVADELQRIEQEGLLVPGQLGEAELAEGAVPPLVWEKGPIDIGRVQQFWPTAPPEGEPGGSPSAWYTNPQTEAVVCLCLAAFICSIPDSKRSDITAFIFRISRPIRRGCII